MTNTSKFDFYEKVLITSKNKAYSSVLGQTGAIVGRAQNENGEWSYVVWIYRGEECWSCQESDLKSTGEFDKEETFSSKLICNSKWELYGFLFHLRTPLHAIRQVAKLTFECVELRSNMPLEAITWLEKWAPKIDSWVSEVSRLTYLYGEHETEDQDWKELTGQLIRTLDGVETATIEANGIVVSDDRKDKDMVDLMVGSISYVDKHYQRIRDLLPALE